MGRRFLIGMAIPLVFIGGVACVFLAFNWLFGLWMNAEYAMSLAIITTVAVLCGALLAAIGD